MKKRKKAPAARKKAVKSAERETTEKPMGQTEPRKSSVGGPGVVGIGASAGGLEAFMRLLSNLAPDTGLAYVLVQHLSREHDSLLPELLEIGRAHV